MKQKLPLQKQLNKYSPLYAKLAGDLCIWGTTNPKKMVC